VGNLLTALFAQASVAAFDGFTVIPGGWIDHHYVQLGWHVADSLAGLGYSFVMTVSISFLFLEGSLGAPSYLFARFVFLPPTPFSTLRDKTLTYCLLM